MNCNGYECGSQVPRSRSPCMISEAQQNSRPKSPCMVSEISNIPRPKSPCTVSEAIQYSRPKSPCIISEASQFSRSRSPCTVSESSTFSRPKSPCSLSEASQYSRPKPPCMVPEAPQMHRIQNNCMMLDLRKQIQWQSQVIRDLKIERDRLTKELASRLFFVEAQLRREQKHIESLLSEKDQYIRFQGLQIQSLKSILSQVDWDYRQHQKCGQNSRPASTNSSIRRGKAHPPMDKRYSCAMDEYMKDNIPVSRARPVLVEADTESEKKSTSNKMQSFSGCSRARSLPELRINPPDNQKYLSCDFSSYYQSISDLGLPQDIIDELASRRWTSDCDSEHSDSLDSGISSPSIKSRNMHLSGFPLPCVTSNSKLKQDGVQQSRGSTIGNFLNRTFSLSSSQIDKIKSNEEYSDKHGTGRRHGSFSVSKTKSFEHECCPMQKREEEEKPRNRFISSANRTFGTNHRSVTKPRDIKFRKLFKFRRRSEPVDQGVINPEDYMMV